MSRGTVVVGDAGDAAVLGRALDGRAPRLLLTDPPYCLLTRRRKGGDVREPRMGRKIDREPIHRFEDVRAYRRFTEAWLPGALASLDAEATAVIWTNFLGKRPLSDVASASGFAHLAGEFVWAKRTTGRSGNEENLRVYEVALVLRRAPFPAPGPDGRACPWAVVAGYDDDGEGRRWGGHPNHKPFSVLEPLLRTWSEPEDLVLDCFAGSGSILAAAVRLGREALGIELDPAWAARAGERLERLS